MKVLSVMAFIGFLVSLPVVAEPYAEWGVVGGESMQLYSDGATIPEASDVPIPLAPGGVVVGVISHKEICQLAVRTKQSVEDTCAFYKNVLNPAAYQEATPPSLRGVLGCDLIKDGDSGDFGVRIHKNTSPMHERNGFTLVSVTYQPGRCE